MELVRIGVSGFRAIQGEGVSIPLEGMTVLLGRNNVGKSSVLRAVEWVLTSLRHPFPANGPVLPTGLDALNANPATGARIELGLRAGTESHLARVAEAGFTVEATLEMKAGQLASKFTSSLGNQFAAVRDRDLSHAAARELLDDGLPQHMPPQDVGPYLMQQLTKWVPTKVRPAIPKVTFVHDSRKITPGSGVLGDGAGIIDEVFRWRDADPQQKGLRPKFRALEQILREYLGLPDAAITVRQDRSTLLIEAGGRHLPLSNWGAGVSQLLVLAVNMLANDTAVICIEEPETHLHPGMQRIIAAQMASLPGVKWMVSTHSPTLVDAVLAAAAGHGRPAHVLHVTNQDGVVHARQTTDTASHWSALTDLGASPSDLLMTRSVVWVEGPSDRIYLLKWLALLDAQLVEGRDFSIVFYGGRLLAHVSVADTVAEEFVQLLRVNPRSAVIMDSDRREEGDPLNATKRRVIEEAKKSGAHTWVTHGREIENDLAAGPVARATGARIGEAAPGSFESFPEWLIEHPTEDGNVIDYAAGKVHWARKIADLYKLEDLGEDLKLELGGLIAFIRGGTDSGPPKVTQALRLRKRS